MWYEAIALVGACAWVPQLLAWIGKLREKPEVVIVPEDRIAISYTGYGPIIILRVVLASLNQDIVIEKIKIELKKPDGGKISFEWSFFNEQFSELGDASTGNKQSFYRQGKPIALMLNYNRSQEKSVYFHIKSKIDEFDSDVLRLEESIDRYGQGLFVINQYEFEQESAIKNYVDTLRNNFELVVGKYSIEFNVESNSKYMLRKNQYNFCLDQKNIDMLKDSLELVHQDLYQRVISKTAELINWNWITVSLSR